MLFLATNNLFQFHAFFIEPVFVLSYSSAEFLFGYLILD